jgi:hypothetical protein
VAKKHKVLGTSIESLANHRLTGLQPKPPDRDLSLRGQGQFQVASRAANRHNSGLIGMGGRRDINCNQFRNDVAVGAFPVQAPEFGAGPHERGVLDVRQARLPHFRTVEGSLTENLAAGTQQIDLARGCIRANAGRAIERLLFHIASRELAQIEGASHSANGPDFTVFQTNVAQPRGFQGGVGE